MARDPAACLADPSRLSPCQRRPFATRLCPRGRAHAEMCPIPSVPSEGTGLMPPSPPSTRYFALQMLRSAAEPRGAAQAMLDGLRASADRGDKAEATLSMLRAAVDTEVGKEHLASQCTRRPHPSTARKGSALEAAREGANEQPLFLLHAHKPLAGCIKEARAQNELSSPPCMIDYLSDLVDVALSGVASRVFGDIDPNKSDDQCALAEAATSGVVQTRHSTVSGTSASCWARERLPSLRLDSCAGHESTPIQQAFSSADCLESSVQVAPTSKAAHDPPRPIQQPARPSSSRRPRQFHRQKWRAASADRTPGHAELARRKVHRIEGTGRLPIPSKVPLSARAHCPDAGFEPEDLQSRNGALALSARASQVKSHESTAKSAMMLDLGCNASTGPLSDYAAGGFDSKAPSALPRIARTVEVETSWRSRMDRLGMQEDYWRRHHIL